MGGSESKCEKNETIKTSEDALESLNLDKTETNNSKNGKAQMPVIENKQTDEEKEKNQSGGDANNYTFEKYNIFKVLNELENMDAKTVMEGGQEINFNSTTDDLKVITKLKNAVNSKKPVNSYKNQPQKPITHKGGNAENKNPVIFRKPLQPPVNMPQNPTTYKGGNAENKNPVIFRKPLHPPVNMPEKPMTYKGGNAENDDKNNFKTYLLDELNAQKGGGSKCATCNQSGGCGCEQSGGKKSKKSSSSSSDSSSSDSSSSSTSSTSSTSSSSTSSDSVKQGGTSNDSYSRGLHIFPFESSISGGDSSCSSNHKLLRRHL